MNSKDWFWCMDYCKNNGLPPAQKFGWDAAKKALKEKKNGNG